MGMKGLFLLLFILSLTSCKLFEFEERCIKIGELVNLEYMENKEQHLSGSALGVGFIGGGTIESNEEVVQLYRFYIKNMNGEIYMANIEPKFVSFIESDKLDVQVRYVTNPNNPKSINEILSLTEYHLRRGEFGYYHIGKRIIFYIPKDSIKKYITL